MPLTDGELCFVANVVVKAGRVIKDSEVVASSLAAGPVVALANDGAFTEGEVCRAVELAGD